MIKRLKWNVLYGDAEELRSHGSDSDDSAAAGTVDSAAALRHLADNHIDPLDDTAGIFLPKILSDDEEEDNGETEQKRKGKEKKRKAKERMNEGLREDNRDYTQARTRPSSKDSSPVVSTSKARPQRAENTSSMDINSQRNDGGKVAEEAGVGVGKVDANDVDDGSDTFIITVKDRKTVWWECTLCPRRRLLNHTDVRTHVASKRHRRRTEKKKAGVVNEAQGHVGKRDEGDGVDGGVTGGDVVDDAAVLKESKREKSRLGVRLPIARKKKASKRRSRAKAKGTV